jgi:hypothetical protein
MIQPSLTGLVHALFATQHCVLGYYQVVPAGLYATNSCRNSGAGEGCTSYRTAVGATRHDSAVPLRPGLPWGKAWKMYKLQRTGFRPYVNPVIQCVMA